MIHRIFVVFVSIVAIQVANPAHDPVMEFELLLGLVSGKGFLKKMHADLRFHEGLVKHVIVYVSSQRINNKYMAKTKLERRKN